MALQQIHSQGIYHALPVYDESINGLTAVITGANGISGNYMLRVLLRTPQRWKRIICLSRRPPLIHGSLPDHVEHIPLDFLREPEHIAAVLKERRVVADYVFFFSYIQPPPGENAGDIWSAAEELCRVNTALLDNFLKAVTLANVKPKRFLLQTGAKNYGIHLGPTKLPQEEIDPRVTLDPNFYYPQEDLLWDWAERNGSTWNITIPGPILGAVPDAAMNLAFALAVYAAVDHHLGRSLEFPSDFTAWQTPQIMSSAMLNAYQEEWAVLTAPPNQKFNTCDDSAFTWEKTWPRLAGWYGLEAVGPQEGDAYILGKHTPFSPRGYGDTAVPRRKFSIVEWAQKPEIRQAWKELADRHGLVQAILKDVERVFGILDFSVSLVSPMMYSTDKARKAGWHGFVDSSESLLEVFDGLAALKMIPPVPKVKLNFN